MRTLREISNETKLSPATMCRFASGKDLSQESLITLLGWLDKDLAEEVRSALSYLRTAINRRAKS